ncbi:MAG: SoxR reducing system RseC family protein [candidate division WOR-3 bacterium]|nr:MAG: SoxR reducing system RseC family protein [candidate division WOR-3 bacterium]
MRKKGRVIAVEGSRATICFDSVETCERCEAKKYCQSSAPDHSVTAENHVGAMAGDEVYVEQTPGIGLAAASLLFGLPVVLALIGMIVGSRWNELRALILAVICFGLGLVIAKLLNNIIARRSAFLPRITEIIEREGS